MSCPVLVGRHRELAVLHEAKRALGKNQATVVLVEGEAGIGKSRLLDQFFTDMRSDRARTIAAADCLEYARAPLGPIREVLGSLAHGAARPLPPLLSRFADRADANGAIDKAELFTAVTDFMRACALKRATIVKLEDLHWADAMTLEFLGFAASRLAGARVLIVATFRSSDLEQSAQLRAAIARLMREPATLRVELGRLAQADVRALIARALEGHRPLPQPIVERVISRADGNPFFAEELLKDSLTRPETGVRSPLPVSIRASIVERLGAFDPLERAVIDRAAVLGVRFDPYVLAHLLQTDIDAVLPALRKARDINLIEEEDADRVRFRFRHALTRQAVYDELLLFDARRTHRAILAALEELGTETQHFEELAYHAWEARDPAKTLRYNERAADAAFALQALPDARTGYERALEVATDPADRARLFERVMRVTALMGDLPRAIELYEPAFAAAIAVGDIEAAGRLTIWSAADRSNSGDASAVAFGLAFLERWGDQLLTESRDRLLALFARLATIVHDFALATALVERIADDAALPPGARQNVLNVRFDIAWYGGDVRGWSAAAQQLLDMLPTLELFPALNVCYSVAQGASYQARDDLVVRALSFADRVEKRGEFAGLDGYGIAIRAADFFARGKLEDARAAIRTALAMPNVEVATAALALVAPFVADALDDDTLVPPEIEAEFELVRARARHVDDAGVLGAAALWSLRNGRGIRALSDVRRALELHAGSIVHFASVVLLAAQHLPVAELALLDRFCDPDARAADDALGRAHAFAIASIVAQRRGDLASAQTFGTAAAEAYERLGRPLFAAQAYESAGDPSAARTLYERCGATLWAKRLIDQTTPGGSREDPLSDRERAVAQLMAAGLNNVAIGERLSISRKTVEKHVASIYDKLGVRTRPQVALLVSSENAAQREGAARSSG